MAQLLWKASSLKSLFNRDHVIVVTLKKVHVQHATQTPLPRLATERKKMANRKKTCHRERI